MDGDAAAVPGSYPGGSASPTRPSKKATVDALRTDLASLGLDTKGKKDTLFRRLMGWWTTRVEPASEADKPGEADTEEVVGIERLLPAPKQPFSSFLCFDVEATCEAGVNFDYPNEIIWADEEPPTPAEAGPSASAKATAHGQRKQRVRRLVKVDTFHTYVRPTWQPRLSEFCTGLTGITQETVDTAPTFPEALLKLEDWMDSWGLRDGDQLRDAMWVTDGPWDLRDFIPKQLHITPTSPPRYPAYLLAPYLNIKTAVQSYLTETHKRSQGYPDESPSKLSSARSSPAGKKRPKDKIVGRLTTGHVTSRTTKDRFKAMGIDYYLNIKGMLKALEIGEFEGHLHSGIDDATNVARILIAIANQDVLIEPNSRLPPPKNAKQWSWMGKRGQVIWPPPEPERLQRGRSEGPPQLAPSSVPEAVDAAASAVASTPVPPAGASLIESPVADRDVVNGDVAAEPASVAQPTSSSSPLFVESPPASSSPAATTSASTPSALMLNHADPPRSATSTSDTSLGPEHLLVLYASETGNSHDLAERVAREVRRNGARAMCLSMEEYDIQDLVHETLVVFVTSTHGRGDPPGAMKPLWAKLIRTHLPGDMFEDLHYSVYGLGESSYDRFCEAGKMLARRLEGLGAHKLVESIWGDERAPDGYEETFVPWLKQILDTVLPYLPIALASTSLKATELPPPIFRLKSLDASAITAAISEDVPVSESTWAWCPEGWTWATLVRNERVTPKEWWQDVREVHLEPDLPTAYPPGSICSLIPQSGPEEVERFIDVTGLADVADRPFALESTVDHPLPPHLPRTPTTLRALLLNHLDLRSPPRKSFFEWLRRFCEPSQDREIDRLDEFIADPDEVHTYATRSKRTIVETLAEFNTIKIPLEYVCELVPGIRRRQFSIAGSAEKHGGKVELLVTLVEYKTNLKIPRRGLCSSWLEGLQPGTRLAIRIDQPTLELPSAETPLILVGPGTGVAPMRALVETRIRQQASETALYFGHRMSTADAYYASEWEAWRQCGVRVEIAASRDGPEKVYVQHLIKRDSVMIRDWLKRGAWVMISGSSNTMPRQVREALAYALSKEAGGDMDASEAGAYVEAMFDSERGQEESW